MPIAILVILGAPPAPEESRVTLANM